MSDLDTQVRSLMRAGVISLPDDASVRQVQRAIVSHGVHAVLVVSAMDGRPLGWATARAVLDRLPSDTGLVPAAAAASEPVETISPAASAREALLAMQRTGAPRLLVCREPGGHPEGVLSEMDLLRLGV